MMTDLAAPKALFVSAFAGAAAAFQDRNSGRFNPSKPAPPTRSSSRRDQPSQVRTGCPGIVSMCLLLGQDYITGYQTLLRAFHSGDPPCNTGKNTDAPQPPGSSIDTSSPGPAFRARKRP